MNLNFSVSPAPPSSYAEVLTPSASECDCIWRQRLYQVKVRPLEWDLIQYDWCPYKMEKLDTYIEGIYREDAEEGDGYQQTKERGLE